MNDQSQKPKSVFGRLLAFLKWSILSVIVVSILSGLGYWAWYTYEYRPQVVTELVGVELGSRPVDVTLQLGKPNADTNEMDDVPEEFAGRYFFYEGYKNIRVAFGEAGLVTSVCSDHYYDDVFDLGVYDREDEIVSKLGEPDKVSINQTGLRKAISYPQWNVVFVLEEGSVVQTCIDEDGFEYLYEYEED